MAEPQVTLRPISERAAKIALEDGAVADALIKGTPATGIDKGDALDAKRVAYSGVEALGLVFIFDAGKPIGSETKLGRARLLDAADADRALMAVRDVTWSGGDDIRDDLEKVFAHAVDGNFHIVVALSE
jgi:hypothetical protein